MFKHGFFEINNTVVISININISSSYSNYKYRVILLEYYLWEYNGHWVRSVFMFKSTVFEYSHSIGAKLSVQESVDEEDLSYDIDEVKYFAQEKP